MEFANNKEFNERIEKVGQLYEEGKDCAFEITPTEFQSDVEAHTRLLEILRELRDIACTQIQETHKVNKN